MQASNCWCLWENYLKKPPNKLDARIFWFVFFIYVFFFFKVNNLELLSKNTHFYHKNFIWTHINWTVCRCIDAEFRVEIDKNKEASPPCRTFAQLNTMNANDQLEMTELAETYPDKTDFYTKMKTNRDIYEEELKRLHNEGLELWYKIALLKLDLTKITNYNKKHLDNQRN